MYATDGTGTIDATNGAFVVVGTNATNNTAARYFVAAVADDTKTVAESLALAAVAAVKIVDITMVGQARTLAAFVGVA